MRDALNNLHIFKTVRVKVSASPGGVLGPPPVNEGRTSISGTPPNYGYPDNSLKTITPFRVELSKCKKWSNFVVGRRLRFMLMGI